jgi:hypothetical protein
MMSKMPTSYRCRQFRLNLQTFRYFNNAKPEKDNMGRANFIVLVPGATVRGKSGMAA